MEELDREWGIPIHLSDGYEIPCSRIPSSPMRETRPTHNEQTNETAESFTPWFKLIVSKFLFPWWDKLVANQAAAAASGDKQQAFDALSLKELKDDQIHRLL